MFRALTISLAAAMALTAPVPGVAAVFDGLAVATDLDFATFARGGSGSSGSDDSGGGSDDDRSGSDDDDDSSGSGSGRGRGDSSDDNGLSGSGRDRPRIPGGSGCDDPGDIAEHPECTP